MIGAISNSLLAEGWQCSFVVSVKRSSYIVWWRWWPLHTPSIKTLFFDNNYLHRQFLPPHRMSCSCALSATMMKMISRCIHTWMHGYWMVTYARNVSKSFPLNNSLIRIDCQNCWQRCVPRFYAATAATHNHTLSISFLFPFVPLCLLLFWILCVALHLRIVNPKWHWYTRTHTRTDARTKAKLNTSHRQFLFVERYSVRRAIRSKRTNERMNVEWKKR